MKKKLISSTAIALLFSASAVFAGGPEMVIVGPSPFDGFYLGGFGSFQQVGFDIDGQTDLVVNKKNQTSTFVLATQDGGDSDSRAYGGVLGGWGKVFMNRWYGSVEGFAAFGNASGDVTTTVFPSTTTTSDSITFTNSARVNTNWGVNARLGALLSPTTLAYAILGAEWANIKACINGTTNGGDTTFVNNSCNSETKPGFLWGFGTEQLVWRNVSIFAQYTYVNLQHVTVSTTNNLSSHHDGDGVGDCDHEKSAIKFSNTVKAEISAFTGGLIVHFGSNWF
jgi:opacity protein-like surface antigen